MALTHQIRAQLTPRGAAMRDLLVRTMRRLDPLSRPDLRVLDSEAAERGYLQMLREAQAAEAAMLTGASAPSPPTAGLVEAGASTGST